MSGSWQKMSSAGAGPSNLSPVGRRSCVGLPDSDGCDSGSLGHRVHLPRSLVIKKLCKILRRGIDGIEGRLIVQELVIDSLNDTANHALQMREIKEQANRIQSGPFEDNSHFVIVPLRVLALPLIA